MSTYMVTKYEQWLDGKPDIQHFIDFAQNATQPPPAAAQLVKVQNDYDIIMELGNMYNNVELTQLTPPQTPPQSQDCIGTNNEMLDVVPQPQLTNFNQYDMIKDDSGIAMSPTSSMLDYSSEVSYCSVSPAMAREIQIVDEILANRIKDLPDFSNEDSMFSMTSSSLSQSNDEEWLPSPSSSVASPSTSKIIDGGITKRRVRPHGRCVEEKKSRKKEQNKNAATRYRQKKKQEMDEILEEERLLTVRNDELKKNVSEVRSEVKYLKQLARELFRSRGLIN